MMFHMKQKQREDQTIARFIDLVSNSFHLRGEYLKCETSGTEITESTYLKSCTSSFHDLDQS